MDFAWKSITGRQTDIAAKRREPVGNNAIRPAIPRIEKHTFQCGYL
jgi:hypothetical protein